jgi:hypothetical protein
MSAKVFKYFVGYLFILVAGFLLVDRSIALALSWIVKQSEFRFSKVYKGGMSPDVLIFGNSRSVNAFYGPDIESRVGVDVFHLGYNGMPMQIVETVLLDYLDYNVAPELILLEVTNLGARSEQLKEQKLFLGFSLNLQDLLARDFPMIYRTCQLTHLYRFNNELFFRTLFYINRSDQSWINAGTINQSFADNVEITEPESRNNMLSLDGDGWPALQRILELCDRESIEVRLVVSPYLPRLAASFTAYSEWKHEFMKQLPQNVKLFDYYNALSKAEYFADKIHINRAGSAALLGQMIADDLFKLEKPSSTLLDEVKQVK